MNYRLIINQLALLMVVLSAVKLAVSGTFFGIQSAWGNLFDANSHLALLLTGGAGLVLGGIIWFGSRGGVGAVSNVSRRDALLLVGISWVFGSALAATPFWLWAHLRFGPNETHPFLSFVNCYFESVSGLTTTGSSVLTDVESLPRSMLLWRAATHWLGGVGIVVLFVAVFPAVGVGAKRLFQFETSGVTKQGVLPTIQATARALTMIYIALTAVQVLALALAGMSWFDAICHSFATLATGGFSTRNASVGGYDSVWIDAIITLFMIVGGVNFALYHQMLRGRGRDALRDPELRLYLGLVFGASVLIALIMVGRPIITSAGTAITSPDFFQAFRFSIFNIASVQTTTGFANADYDLWPIMPKAIIFVVMLVGGSAGSTAGGLKVVRVLITGKILVGLLERTFRPSVVRPIRVGKSIISADIQLATMGYVLTTLFVLAISTLLMMLLEPAAAINLTEAITASVAAFCNIGPGFGKVGPVANFGWLSDGSKLVLCAVMLLGRLELMALAALLMPSFWRNR